MRSPAARRRCWSPTSACPAQSGLELLQAVKERHPAVPVIVMTAYSDLDSAVAAFQGGAYEYLPKPFDVDQAVELIRRALDESRREAEAAASRSARRPEILGQAPAMQEVFRAIGRLSQSSATVLITGESGTGKELVARALHRHSPRAAKPFVAINTAAMPEGPARIGAVRPRARRVHRRAAAAARPLRAGRRRHAVPRTRSATCRPSCRRGCCACCPTATFYRVGGHQQIKANVRVIAATHQNLEERVREGSFREDLYHRLNVDPPAAAARCASAPRTSRCSRGISSQQSAQRARRRAEAPVGRGAARISRGSRFPGNVRQLENLCHWLTVMAPGQVIDVGDLPAEFRDQAAASGRSGLARGARAGSRAAPARAARPASSTQLGAPVRARADRAARWRAPAAGASRRPTCSAWAATPSPARSRSSASRRCRTERS